MTVPAIYSLSDLPPIRFAFWFAIGFFFGCMIWLVEWALKEGK